ncbi:MAG: nitroreductase family protein [Bacillota bacterium]|jgi:coenzyme F420-0:L-glutamate ligase/coenzyme F420-1:gamma-L-glutamate ligase
MGQSLWNIQELIKKRRTVRQYLKKPVTEQMIFDLIEIARWAPSAHNAQPWRFVLIKNQDKRQLLVELMAEAWQKDMMKDGKSEDAIRLKLSQSKQRFLSSPVLLLACLTMEEMDCYPDPARQAHEHTLAVQSLGAFLQTFLLAAFGQGLGSGWFCAPLFCQEIVKEVLALPDDYLPQAFVTLGYPEEVPAAPPRKKVDEILIVR